MSKIDSLNSRPATHVLTTRLDARHLATLARFWHRQGELPRSASELIRLSVETFVEFLVLNNKTEMIQKYEDALQILTSTGITVKSVNRRNLAQALTEEGATLNLSTPAIDSKHKKTVASNPVSNIEVNAAQAGLETRLAEALAKRTQDEKDQLADFKENLLNPQVESSDEESND